VRAEHDECPFCARDARREPASLARPAAAVIAALVALSPGDTRAERPHLEARSAQSLPVQAYGAPAPMYGMPPPPDAPRYQVSIARLRTNRGSPARFQGIVQRSMQYASQCAAVVARRVGPNAPPTLESSVRVQVAADGAPTVDVRSRPSPLSPMLESCLRARLRSAPMPAERAPYVVEWVLRYRRI
jgi:hypothetical protein